MVLFHDNAPLFQTGSSTTTLAGVSSPPGPGPRVGVLDMPVHQVVVDDARITYRRCGPRGDAPVLLVHGRAAHSGWWFAVAPDLARHRDVAIVDLSGHGDSEHRTAYAPGTWADELAAVIADLGVGPADVVGHSMGGQLAVYLAARSPDSVRTVVMIDSRVGREPYRAPAHDVVRYYPTLDVALDSFRLRPRATTAPAALLRSVARHGLRETEQGWRWIFDPRSGQPFTAQDIEGALAGSRCPIGVVYGELSELASDASADHIASRTGREVPRVGVPDAHHHVPLDRGDACLAAIESLLTHLKPTP